MLSPPSGTRQIDSQWEVLTVQSEKERETETEIERKEGKKEKKERKMDIQIGKNEVKLPLVQMTRE